jgi:hypothetical protein
MPIFMQILMHQMRIMTNYVFSVMLIPQNLEIRNIDKAVKREKIG